MRRNDGGASNRYRNQKEGLAHGKNEDLACSSGSPGFMDHIQVPFLDYLWISWILRPSTIVTTLFGGKKQRGLWGIVSMQIREHFDLSPQKSPKMLRTILLKLIMETSIVAWVSVETVNEREIGLLKIPEAFHALTNGEWESGTLIVEMDLSEQEILDIRYKGKTVDIGDGLALVYIALTGMNHPLIHSFANWGINPEIKDDFLKTMALCTIKYNEYGVNQFRTTTNSFRWLGIHSYTTMDILKLATHHGNYTVPKHSSQSWTALKEKSDFVDFILKVRVVFFNRFKKYKNDFSQMDPEGMFLGTVMHSVDHLQFDYLLEISDFKGTEVFKADRELATVILSCYTSAPLFRLINCKFKDSPHPFFQEVYKEAMVFNKRMADGMECCIAI